MHDEVTCPLCQRDRRVCLDEDDLRCSNTQCIGYNQPRSVTDQPRRVLSSAGRQGRISQLRAQLRECNRLMEPMDGRTMAELQRLENEERDCVAYEASIPTDDIPVQPTHLSTAKLQQFAARLREEFPDEAVIKQTCARCSHAFTSAKNAGPLAATSAGMLSEALENEIAAHQERCLIVGDWLRFEHSRGTCWIEGPVTTLCNEYGYHEIRPERQSGMEEYTGKPYSFQWPDKVGNVRRIPRPQQGEAVGVHASMAAFVENLRQEFPAADMKWVKAAPTPTLYDGLSRHDCYQRWIDNRLQVEYGHPTVHVMTPDQIACAKAEHAVANGKWWSLMLRAKVAASATEERNRVRVELQCDEDPTW